MSSRVGVFLFLFILANVVVGQQNCPSAPALRPVSTSENIFSDAQEVDLGDAMSETVALHVNVIRDEELTAHVRDIGNQLVQYLPPSHLNFRFYLVDLPEVNAFSIAGGRVYVSRKLVAFARNDDELAGVLGHELGHIVTHQTAIEMTRNFREVLRVTQVGDRNDVFKKFHQYVENASKHPRFKHDQEDKQQLVADQVAIFTIAVAGFSPRALVDFWDRFGELHGKQGNWFTDLFGATTPEQHRLRDMVKNTASLPSGCARHASVSDEASFKTWQESVVDYDVGQQIESLPGLISKHRLTQRLRPDISNLRFSPDGKYILAQDDGGISVVSREPFAFVFYIPAPDARAARFSPDSSSVVFLASGLRAEEWTISTHKRESVHEIALHEPCLQAELSPDGKMFACLNTQSALVLVDVVTGSILEEKKAFFTPSFGELLSLLMAGVADREAGEDPPSREDAFHFVSMGFSPDAHFFLAAHGWLNGPTKDLMYDIVNRREVSVPDSIKSLAPLGFTFLGPNRIAGINPESPQYSHVLLFPSGTLESNVRLARQTKVRGATHGNFLFVGPLEHDPLGMMDLNSKKIVMSFKHDAADVFDNLFVTERTDGELALRTTGNADLVALLQLPEAGLGRLTAATVSGDLNYLALSTHTRGAVWNLGRDARLFYTRNFNAAGFDGSLAFADFPKFQESPRAIGELNLDSGVTASHREFNNEIVTQHGNYLVEIKPRSKNRIDRSNADLQVQDVRTGQLLWSRYFPGSLPSMSFDSSDSTVLMYWRLSEAGAEDELKRFAELKGKADKNDYLCEIADANLGGLITAFVIRSNNGSMRYLHGSATHHWAVMAATGDQILTYSLPAGEERGHFFGTRPILSASGILAVNSEKHEVTTYDLATSQVLQHYVFAAPVALKMFSADSKQLLVFTNDQTVYLLDATAAALAVEPAVAANP